MATFTAIRNAKQTAGTLAGVLRYIMQDEKTSLDGISLVMGNNCLAQSAYTEMQTTKQRFKKTDGQQFFHFVQSFSPSEKVTPQEVNAIGLELAQREFPGYEAVVATHIDTDHLHNHIVVNSVSFETGKKLHQNTADLMKHRQANDEICAAHGLSVLPPQQEKKSQGMSSREYRSAVKGESWKLQLMFVIDECMRFARSKEEFIALMKSEGYDVKWTDSRKSITYTCPNGMKCRDDRLHEAKYTKERMEHEFRNRAEIIHGGIETEESPNHSMDSVTRGLERADSPFVGHLQETDKLPDLRPNRGTDAFCAGVAANGGTGWEEERTFIFSAENQTTRVASRPGQSDQIHCRSGMLIGAMCGVLQFGADLGRISPTAPVKDATTIPHRIDRKRWKKLMRKQLAMGHKIGDITAMI